MKIKFIHWNLNRILNDLKDDVINIIKDYDVVVLVECSDEMLHSIKDALKLDKVEFSKISKLKKWVYVLYKENLEYKITHHTEIIDDNIKANYRDQNRVQVFKISGKLVNTYFAVLHFTSKSQTDEIKQFNLARNYKNKIHDLTFNNDRIFIVGDFNMNPFDLGMISPYAFFSHNNQELLENDKRYVDKKLRPIYYNPCWALLGDFITRSSYADSKRTGGSYYFESGLSRDYRWSILDQVIMRKSLLEEFECKDLEIIENEDLVKNHIKRIDIKEGRIDHLPLKFTFNFK